MEPTERIPVDPHRLFVLTGPAWEETKEGRRKQFTPAEEQRRNAHRISNWLAEHALQLGMPVTAPLQGPRDSDPWILYRVVPMQ